MYALGEHDPGSAQDWKTSSDFCSPAHTHVIKYISLVSSQGTVHKKKDLCLCNVMLVHTIRIDEEPRFQKRQYEHQKAVRAPLSGSV